MVPDAASASHWHCAPQGFPGFSGGQICDPLQRIVAGIRMNGNLKFCVSSKQLFALDISKISTPPSQSMSALVFDPGRSWQIGWPNKSRWKNLGTKGYKRTEKKYMEKSRMLWQISKNILLKRCHLPFPVLKKVVSFQRSISFPSVSTYMSNSSGDIEKTLRAPNHLNARDPWHWPGFTFEKIGRCFTE